MPFLFKGLLVVVKNSAATETGYNSDVFIFNKMIKRCNL